MSDGVGRAFPLLLYRRAIGRFRRPGLVLALLLLGLWLLVREGLVAWPARSGAPWLLAGGLVATFFWAFTVLGPRLAYVQPRQDHVRVQTPIYRLKISYRRIATTRPVNLTKIFDVPALNSAEQRLLKPFLGETALALDLRGYPLGPFWLQLFFHRLFLTPDGTGFVLVVDDWMELSEQISDHLEADRSQRSDRQAEPFSDAARILSED